MHFSAAKLETQLFVKKIKYKKLAPERNLYNFQFLNYRIGISLVTQTNKQAKKNNDLK